MKPQGKKRWCFGQSAGSKQEIWTNQRKKQARGRAWYNSLLHFVIIQSQVLRLGPRFLMILGFVLWKAKGCWFFWNHWHSYNMVYPCYVCWFLDPSNHRYHLGKTIITPHTFGHGLYTTYLWRFAGWFALLFYPHRKSTIVQASESADKPTS